MIKKDPYYRVTVYSNKETVIVEYPITCKFTINRGVFSQSSKCTIQLYNLAPATRNKIFQDVFTLDWYKQKYVHLEAGYGGKDNMSIIFKGRILQAYSHKSGGQTDVITEIQAQALDIFDCQTSNTFAAGTSYREAYKTIINDLPGTTLGNLGSLEGTFKTSTTFDGNAFDALNTLTDGHTFVDNNVINTIMDNEVIDVPVPVISDSSGLLETPVRRGANLEVKMLFEPTLIIGQLLEINSEIQPIFNGQFKVLGFTHDCLISPTQSGTRTTTVNLWIAPLLPSSVISVTGEEVNKGRTTGGAADISFNKVKGEKVTPGVENLPSNVREVYQYIQKNGIAPHTHITKNIYWDEVVKPNSLKYEKPSLEILTNLYYTSYRIQVFVDTYYPGSRVQVNSGWRSKGYNNTLGNADPNSEHLYGNAIDFMIIGQTPQTVYNQFLKYWKGRKYLHKAWGFIHADITTSRGVYANDW